MVRPVIDDDFEVENLDIKSLVRDAAKKYKVPEDLALKLASQESAFNPRARSHKGAYGPMQLMAGTARDLGVNRYDPVQNVDGGMRYLAQNLERYKGDQRKAVAAYNAGPGAVDRYGDVPPYAETQEYVRKILGDPVTPVLDGGIEMEGLVAQAPAAKAMPAAKAAPAVTPVLDDNFMIEPSVSARPRSLGERWTDNFRQAARSTIMGALGERAGVAVDRSYADRVKDEELRYQLASKADPFYDAPGGIPGKLAALGATLGGMVGGSVTSPEALVGPGKTRLGRIGWNAAINAGLDLPTQGLQISSGTRDKYDPKQTAIAGATGVVVQGGVEGAGVAKAAMGELGKRLKTRLGMEDFSPMQPRLSPEEALQPGSGSVVNEKTGQAYTKGQTAQFEDMRSAGNWDEAAAWGTEKRPIAQVEEGVEPPPGTWFVDLAGNLKQAGERQDVVVPPEAVAPTKANEIPTVEDLVVEAPPVRQDPVEAPVDTPPARAEEVTPILDEIEPDEVPIPAQPTPEAKARVEAPETVLEPDQVDVALDYIRKGRQPKTGANPSLTEALRQAGGLKNDGGELDAIDIRQYGAKGGRLVNKSKGMSLDDAAQWAQERGFIGKPDLNERATPQELLDAIRRDLDGDRVHAADNSLDDTMKTLVRDLHEELDFEGIDPNLTNREIRDALKEAWARRDADAMRAEDPMNPRLDDDAMSEAAFYGVKKGAPDPDQGLLPGVEARNDTAEAIAQEILRREGRRVRSGEAGPLFDETGRNQGDLFALRTNFTNQLRNQSRAQPRARKNPAKAEAPAEGARRIEDMAGRFRKALGLVHRQGRLSVGADGLGQYRDRDGAIRTRFVHELDALSHEGFHKLDFDKLPALRKARDQYKAALKDLDYRGKKPDGSHHEGAVEEGFAEWGRWYVTNPDFVKKQTPKIYKAFEEALGKDAPKVLAELQGIQRDYRALLTETPSVDRLRGTIVDLPESQAREFAARTKKEGIVSTVQAWAAHAYKSAFDDVHPISRGVNALREIYKANAGKGLDLKAADDAYKLARLAKDAHTKGKLAIEHGVTPYDGVQPEGPSLTEALSEALGGKWMGWSEDELGEFGLYLTARRMIDEWDRFEAGKIPKPPHTHEKADWQQALDDLDLAHPGWRDASDKVNEWNKNLWTLRRDAGLVTDEVYQAALDEHPFYVPLNRDVSDKGRAVGLGGGGKDGANAGTGHAFRGSTRDFVNPIQSMMREAYELNAMIATNDARVALYKLGQTAGRGSAAIIEKIPNSDVTAIKLKTDEALAAMGLDGMSARDLESVFQAADMDAAINDDIAVFRRTPTSARGEPIIFAWIDGKREALRLADGPLGRDMYEAFVGMPRQLHDVLAGALDIVARTSGLLRYGVTTDPSFILANLFRDQIATWINTDVGFKPGITSTRGLVDEVSQNRIAREYAQFGGIMGGAQTHSFSKTDPGYHGRKVNQAAPGKAVKRFGSLSYITEISETGTRLGVYRLARDRALKEGMSPKDAALEGAFAARDYMDFGRRGSLVGSLTRIVPFLNAGLQSMDKSLRVLTANGNLQKVFLPLVTGKAETKAQQRALNHARRAWVKWAGLGIAGWGLASMYRDDAEFQAFNEDTRAKNWPVKVEDIPLMGEALQSAGIHRKWVALPKPFELASMSNIFERVFEAVEKEDPTAYDKLLKGLANLWTPPSDVPLFKVFGEVRANKTFDGRPIVPEHLKKLDPELQVNSYTSQVMRNLSKAVGDATQWAAGGDREERKTFSPAAAEHVFTGLTGTAGRNAVRLSEKAIRGEDAPASGLDDEMIVARFIKDPTRGSQDSKDFFDRAGEEGLYARASATFRKRYDTDPVDGMTYLRDLSDAQRDYALADKFGSIVWPKKMLPEAWGAGSARMLHPVIRAKAAQSVISDLREEVRQGKVAKADASGPLSLTREQRRDADDALAYLALAEQRTALQAVGVEGYAQKTPIPVADARAELANVDPELLKVLDRLYKAHSGNQGGAIPRAEVAAAQWPRLQLHLRKLEADDMAKAMLKKRTRGAAAKYAERRRQAVEAE